MSGETVDRREDPRRLDVRVDDPGRTGLSGTAPMSVYLPLADPEIVTIAPDGRPHDEQPDWRKEFPIDWPADHHVARREFVKFLTLTSFAFAVGQVWIAVQSFLRRRRGSPQPRKIASLSSLVAGSSLAFEYPGAGDAAVLVRTKDGGLVAYGRECTHLSCAVIPRPDRGAILCPCHEGCFDLATGRPTAGPPRRPLDRILLEMRGDEIWAIGIERRTV